MSSISPLAAAAIAWGAISVVFAVLVIYRSLIAMKEDDQLFLGAAEGTLEAEQARVQAKLRRVTPLVKGFGAASAALLVLMGGIWLYQAMTKAAIQ